MDKFLVIDGSSLIHRAFFALPPLTNSKGQSTGAVFGLCNMLLRLLQEQRPKYLAVAFDKSRHSFRTEMFADYKGQRKPTPPELKEQFPLALQLFSVLGIPALELDEYEADDIIGTFAVHAPNDVEVLIVTGDRDQLQLINDKTKVLFTKHGISDLAVYDETTFSKEYEGLKPVQLIDLKGLMGDASDNIPGVQGVGPKTALKLIKEYGSVEEVLEHSAEVSGKTLQQKLQEHRDMALLSKKLATICTDAPVDLNMNQYLLQPLPGAAAEALASLEFRNMFDKFAVVMGGKDEPESLFDYFAEGKNIIDNPVEFLAKLGDIAIFSVTEKGEIPNLDFGDVEFLFEGKHYFWDNPGEEFYEWLKSPVKKIVNDGKILHRIIMTRGLVVNNLQDDLSLLAYLDNPGSEYTGNLLEDYNILLKSICDKGMEKLYREIELPLTKVLAAMELRGIKPNMTMLRDKGAELFSRIGALEQLAVEQAGEEFNLKSPKQLGSVLFEKLNLPAPKKTKTGYSTDVKVLEKIAPLHPLVGTVLEHRKLTKLFGTYIEGLGVLVNKNTGRIHTHFQQNVTQTGRLSSVNPNLQNIPTRTEEGRLIRQIFEPEEGYVSFMSCDYSQVELRVLAAIAKDEVLLDSFAKGEDIHARTAAEVFGVPREMVTPEMRSRAKAVNFGIVYGISDFGLSEQLKVGRKEAAGYIESYLARYKGVDKYMKAMMEQAHKNGYVETLLGRRRYLPDIHAKNFTLRSFAERTAINTPIQGTAADIMKLAMLKVDQVLTDARVKSRILLQVHDELLLEIVDGEQDKVAELVKNAMESAYVLPGVKLVADVHFGPNWAEAK